MTQRFDAKMFALTGGNQKIGKVASLALRSTPLAMHLAFAKECQRGDDVLVL